MYRRYLGAALMATIAMTTLGYVNPSVAQKPDRCPDHPSCKDDSSDDSGTILFDVVLTEDVPVTVVGTNWQSSSNNQIQYQEFWEQSTGSINLSYFFDRFGKDASADERERGVTCFGSISSDGDVDVFSAILSQAKNGIDATAVIWFRGYPSETIVEILYRLRLDGAIVPQSGLLAEDSVMTLTDWSMHIENQGRWMKEESCLGSEEFDSEDPVILTIDRLSD